MGVIAGAHDGSVALIAVVDVACRTIPARSSIFGGRWSLVDVEPKRETNPTAAAANHDWIIKILLCNNRRFSRSVTTILPVEGRVRTHLRGDLSGHRFCHQASADFIEI